MATWPLGSVFKSCHKPSFSTVPAAIGTMLPGAELVGGRVGVTSAVGVGVGSGATGVTVGMASTEPPVSGLVNSYCTFSARVTAQPK